MFQTFNAIIVDDEESARNVLSNLLLSFCPQINIIDKCNDVESAVISIKKYAPDIVFLDIEMPNYAGYEIVSFFDKIEFEIIFITAYDQYALKAFEVSAVDYLLKPIEIPKLKLAVDKFVSRKKIKDASINYAVLVESMNDSIIKKIVIPNQGEQTVILTKNIIAFEANESYCFIYIKSSPKLMVSKNLKHFETLLDSNTNFIRTHKSWLINLDYLKTYSKSALSIELEQSINAKLSKYKKQNFEEKLAI